MLFKKNLIPAKTMQKQSESELKFNYPPSSLQPRCDSKMIYSGSSYDF